MQIKDSHQLLGSPRSILKSSIRSFIYTISFVAALEHGAAHPIPTVVYFDGFFSDAHAPAFTAAGAEG